MIAKGLDLPLVTLVGVTSADTALNLPDFRAAERTFQLLTQVAGRAGRSHRGGRVIVQTYNPEHYAVQAASQHDYAAFYERVREGGNATQVCSTAPITLFLAALAGRGLAGRVVAHDAFEIVPGSFVSFATVAYGAR